MFTIASCRTTGDPGKMAAVVPMLTSDSPAAALPASRSPPRCCERPSGGSPRRRRTAGFCRLKPVKPPPRPAQSTQQPRSAFQHGPRRGTAWPYLPSAPRAGRPPSRAMSPAPLAHWASTVEVPSRLLPRRTPGVGRLGGSRRAGAFTCCLDLVSFWPLLLSLRRLLVPALRDGRRGSLRLLRRRTLVVRSRATVRAPIEVSQRHCPAGRRRGLTGCSPVCHQRVSLSRAWARSRLTKIECVLENHVRNNNAKQVLAQG